MEVADVWRRSERRYKEIFLLEVDNVEAASHVFIAAETLVSDGTHDVFPSF